MYRVYCDGHLLYRSGLDSLQIGNPNLELEVNKSGSFTFTIYPTHPRYGTPQKLKSIITVYQDNYLLFRGRVLDEETTWYNQTDYACEGELAFLLDSILRPYEFSGSIAEYLAMLLDSHNAQVDEENAIPNATSGTAKVTVTTYSGSTKIGAAVSKTFTVTVPASVVPTISAVTLTEAISGLAAKFGGYVQNKSKISVKITAAGTLSSTIKAYKTTIQGANFTAASFTTGILAKSGTSTVTITVTDSRGRTASTTRSITVAAYAAPKITSFQGFRCLSDGTENYEGTYVKAFINYSISPVSNKNTAAYTVEYKLQSASTWTNLTSGSVYAYNDSMVSASGPFGVDNSFDVRLSVTDYFGTVRSTFEIPTAFTLLDFNKNGRALAFGKVSELSEGVEFGLPAFFSHAETPSSVTYLKDGDDLDTILDPGFYAIPTTAVSGTLINKPYTATSTGSLIVLSEGNGLQRCQILHVASKPDGRIYERSYYTNAWGPWSTVHNGSGRILWTGAMYMTGSHKIALSEAISKQPSGIVLVFIRYDNGEPAEHNYNSFFVHKLLVAQKPGVGSAFRMNTVNYSMICSKYLYINDTTITGNDSNDATGTNNGVTYNNAAYVLRFVFGV